MKIVDVIKFEGDSEVFVWKHPIEDFNTATQLIVHEGQEAIFFRDGQALDLFGPGRYTLQTQNLPLLRRLINLPTGGQTPFHCEVYFINKTMPLNMKWGSTSQIHVLDPKFNILLHAGASGGMGVQIEDSRVFLIKFVGASIGFTKESLTDYFREIIVARVKTHLTNLMSQVSFVTINAHLDDMSRAMLPILAENMREFGVKLFNFIVSTIRLAEKDYELVQTALAEASAVGIAAAAEKGRMATLGYNWADQEMSEILKTYAGNEGSQSNIGGMMAQFPLAMAFGQMLRDNALPAGGAMFSGMPQVFDGSVRNPVPQGAFCPDCGRKLEEDTKFCPGCGKPVVAQASKCGTCGRDWKPDENFCPGCGAKKEG